MKIVSISFQIADQLHENQSLKNVFCLIVSMEAKSHRALYRTIKEIFKAVENGAVLSFERALRVRFAIHDKSLIETPNNEHSYIPGKFKLKKKGEKNLL